MGLTHVWADFCRGAFALSGGFLFAARYARYVMPFRIDDFEGDSSLCNLLTIVGDTPSAREDVRHLVSVVMPDCPREVQVIKFSEPR